MRGEDVVVEDDRALELLRRSQIVDALPDISQARFATRSTD